MVGGYAELSIIRINLDKFDILIIFDTQKTKKRHI